MKCAYCQSQIKPSLVEFAVDREPVCKWCYVSLECNAITLNRMETQDKKAKVIENNVDNIVKE